MTPRLLFPCVAMALLVGCDREGRQDGSTSEPPALDILDPPRAAPHLILYRAPDDGGPEAFMEALIGGTLDLDQPCVAIDTGQGPEAIVTTEGVIDEDDGGPYLQVGPHVLRDGDLIQSGGGHIGDASPRPDMLQEAVPAACAGMPLVELSYIFPAPPPGGLPEAPPTPPPTTS